MLLPAAGISLVKGVPMGEHNAAICSGTSGICVAHHT